MRLEVLRFPAALGSTAASGCAGPGARMVKRRSASPYVCRWSSSILRKCALSGKMSVSSLSAENACWIFPVFCIRSAYSTKFCVASAMNPLAAYSLASLR
ncbi:MAG: hypothetical protein DMD36_08550 [Gemmatimonadetes bacterium]|nr:MAG: hypothetical protein DMD36_08550 [Gemmatimonadota bacterium]